MAEFLKDDELLERIRRQKEQMTSRVDMREVAMEASEISQRTLCAKHDSLETIACAAHHRVGSRRFFTRLAYLFGYRPSEITVDLMDGHELENHVKSCNVCQRWLSWYVETLRELVGGSSE